MYSCFFYSLAVHIYTDLFFLCRMKTYRHALVIKTLATLLPSNIADTFVQHAKHVMMMIQSKYFCSILVPKILRMVLNLFQLPTRFWMAQLHSGGTCRLYSAPKPSRHTPYLLKASLKRVSSSYCHPTTTLAEDKNAKLSKKVSRRHSVHAMQWPSCPAKIGCPEGSI